MQGRILLLAAILIWVLRARSSLKAECQEEPQLTNARGPAAVVCPCFTIGEQAGVVLNAPQDHYPIQILRVGIAWASETGGGLPSLEGAIHVYPKGLPDPGRPLASLVGPALTDGFVNEFTLSPPPVVPAGPFTVSLEFANASTLTGPSVAHDGAACIPGKNVVFSRTGGWEDACALGVSGNWVMDVVYRRVQCGPKAPVFIRGDDNVDGKSDISDPVYTLTFLFLGGAAACLDGMDTNDDGRVDIADPVYNLAFQFTGGPAPPPPYPACGPDPGPSSQGCEMGLSSCP